MSACVFSRFQLRLCGEEEGGVFGGSEKRHSGLWWVLIRFQLRLKFVLKNKVAIQTDRPERSTNRVRDSIARPALWKYNIVSESYFSDGRARCNFKNIDSLIFFFFLSPVISFLIRWKKGQTQCVLPHVHCYVCVYNWLWHIYCFLGALTSGHSTPLPGFMNLDPSSPITSTEICHPLAKTAVFFALHYAFNLSLSRTAWGYLLLVTWWGPTAGFHFKQNTAG